MMYFGNRRPRGFHHHYIYVDERKELLRQLGEGLRPSCDGPSAVDGGRRGAPGPGRRSGGGCLLAGLPALVALLVLLAAVCLFVLL